MAIGDETITPEKTTVIFPSEIIKNGSTDDELSESVLWTDVGWSTCCIDRREFMKTLDMPSISCAKEVLGLPLAELVFCQCHDELKEAFGLTPPLGGPGDLLWVSPSDLLVGKVCLKPPLTQKHIQALTHEGIIEIGRVIEIKYWNEMEIEKQKAVAEREALLNRMFEIEKQQLVSRLQEEERSKYLRELKHVQLYYDNQFTVLIDTLGRQMREQEDIHKATIENIHEIWEKKLEEEVEITVKRLTEEFFNKIAQQEHILVEIFHKQLEEAEATKKCAVEFERIKCKESLIQLKHNLECRNVANLMYLLCKERRKCKKDKQTIESNYLKQVNQQKTIIKSKTHLVNKLTKEKNKKTKQVTVREKCLVEIIRQYRKLINFALKSAPTQAEFLLAVQRMMKYEIDDYCFSKARTREDHDKIIANEKKVKEMETLAALEDANRLPNIESEKMPEEQTDQEFIDSDELPAFYFNNKMYVREDFRDMLLQGIEIKQGSPLWNEDVEELIKIFKETVKPKVPEKETSALVINAMKPHPSSVHFHASDSNPEDQQDKKSYVSHQTIKTANNDSVNSEPFVVSKPNSLMGDEFIKPHRLSGDGGKSPKTKDSKKDVITLKSITSNKLSSKNAEFDDFEDFTKLKSKKSSMTQSRLTLARDSVILRISSMERRSLMNISKTAANTTTTTNEEVQSTKSLNNDSSDIDFVEKTKTSASKLVLACDSLEILKSNTKIASGSRHSVPRLPEPKEDHTSKQSQLTFNQKIGLSYSAPKPAVKPPKNIVKVIGDIYGREYDEKPEKFARKRITSLVKMMKNSPSLIRLFTSCSN